MFISESCFHIVFLSSVLPLYTAMFVRLALVLDKSRVRTALYRVAVIFCKT